MTEFFSWMDQAGHRYVVLRGFQDYAGKGYPRPGRKEDVDLLVDDAVLPLVSARYGRYARRQGTKCDIYNASGQGGGDYAGFGYFPAALAEKALAERRLWHGLFYVPSAEAHLLTLLYHIAYQKAEASRIDITDPEKSADSKYVPELQSLLQETGNKIPLSLDAFHAALGEAGYAIPYDVMVGYLQHDFARDVKSLFRARVMTDLPGEMNLFVIRQVALRNNLQQEIIRALRDHYRILLVKDIPFLTRQMRSKGMRGGKWRRGGKPCIAVVVFDPHPAPTTAEDRKVHPFVFNSRQFMKRELREWFTRVTGEKASQNPIHSTDNEAEAAGHFPLFFSAHEQEDIFDRLARMRHGAAA